MTELPPNLIPPAGIGLAIAERLAMCFPQTSKIDVPHGVEPHVRRRATRPVVTRQGYIHDANPQLAQLRSDSRRPVERIRGCASLLNHPNRQTYPPKATSVRQVSGAHPFQKVVAVARWGQHDHTRRFQPWPTPVLGCHDPTDLRGRSPTSRSQPRSLHNRGAMEPRNRDHESSFSCAKPRENVPRFPRANLVYSTDRGLWITVHQGTFYSCRSRKGRVPHRPQ